MSSARAKFDRPRRRREAVYLRGHCDGRESAARFVEARRDDYIREHGSYDPSTGMTEFPGNGDEYVYELEEIIDGIRRLAAPAKQEGSI